MRRQAVVEGVVEAEERIVWRMPFSFSAIAPLKVKLGIRAATGTGELRELRAAIQPSQSNHLPFRPQEP